MNETTRRGSPQDWPVRGAGALAAFGGLALLLGAFALPAAARDTDIYRESHGTNAVILLDGSSSMDYPVYEASIDYAALYDYYYELSGQELATLTAKAYEADKAQADEKVKERQALGVASSQNAELETMASYYASQCASGNCKIRNAVGKGYYTATWQPDLFYKNHYDKDRIYLIRTPIGYYSYVYPSAASASGYVAMPGDIGHTSRAFGRYGTSTPWISANTPDTSTNTPGTSSPLVDTNTLLKDGKLVDDGTGAARLTTTGGDGATGYVLLDGKRLTLSQDIMLHNYDEFDLTPAKKEGKIERGRPLLDSGFAGNLAAPGYYMSPYVSVTRGNAKNMYANGADYPYFFVTGNYLNFIQSFFLGLFNGSTIISQRNPWNTMVGPDQHTLPISTMYMQNTRNAASQVTKVTGYKYKADWPQSVLPYPVPGADEWTVLDYDLSWPAGLNYGKNITEKESERAIEMPGAKRVQLHFAYLDLGEGDYLHVYDENDLDTEVFTFSSAHNGENFWSGTFEFENIVLRLSSDNDDNMGRGYKIDRVRSNDRNADGYGADYSYGAYVLQSRAGVAREALKTALDKVTDMNWGFYQYGYGAAASGYGVSRDKTGNSYHANNANNYVDVNPSADRETQIARVKLSVDRFLAWGTTPTMQALQELWYYGFYQNARSGNTGLAADNCNSNIIIHVTDGFPTSDSNAGKLKGFGLNIPTQPTWAAKSSQDGYFADWDGDNMMDQSGNKTEFYDDISQWMATHSYRTGEETSEKVQTVTTHNIAFGAKMELLMNASGQTTGSKYAMAGNKTQLIAAIFAMADSTPVAAASSAPAVSVDSSNKLASSLEMYSASYLPRGNEAWYGNVKKYKWGDENRGQDPDHVYGYSDEDRISQVYNADTKQDELKFDGGADYWGDKTYNSGASKTVITDDGAGEVLLKTLCGKDAPPDESGQCAGGHFNTGDYYARPIYTCQLDDNGDPVSEDDPNDKDHPFHCKLVKFDRANITAAMLGVASDEERDRVVNFTHGYTYDRDANGNPVGVRAWPLGAIIHSQPVVVDYYDINRASLPLVNRYIAVGGNDGMVHVFADMRNGAELAAYDGSRTLYSGKEVFAFIPTDMLPKLANMAQPYAGLVDGVDGKITIYRQAMDADASAGDDAAKNGMNPKYMIFGERRGGGHYWCLNIEKDVPVDDGGTVQWKVKWDYTHSEIGQSWSDVTTARVLTKVDATTGKRTYQDVAVFSGGYDEGEDNFPEPFEDTDNSGTPLDANGDPIPARWTYSKDTNGDCANVPNAYDLNGNCRYDIYNPDKDDYGRGIFIVDIDNPYDTEKHKAELKADGGSATVQLLPFIVTYADAYSPTEEEMNAREPMPRDGVQTRADMIWAFPATPSVVTGTAVYSVRAKDEFTEEQKKDVGRHTHTNVLRALYVPDIYANMWKVRLDVTPEYDEASKVWQMNGVGWRVNQIFTTRKTVNSGSADDWAKATPGKYNPPDNEKDIDDDPLLSAVDLGQKAFFGPSVSWGGTRGYFESSGFNYSDPENTNAYSFSGRSEIATLFYGTGDLEHPLYSMVHNRIYSIYDDTAVSADETLVEEDTWLKETPRKVSLPNDGAVPNVRLIEITLTGDVTGPITIPANAEKVVINLGGFKIRGADGTPDNPDGTAAIRLARSNVELILKGPGAVIGGDGADETVEVVMEQVLDPDGNPVLDPDGNPTYAPVQEPVLDPDGNPVLDPDGNPMYRDKTVRTPAGKGGDAIAGADEDTVVRRTEKDKANVAGGAGGGAADDADKGENGELGFTESGYYEEEEGNASGGRSKTYSNVSAKYRESHLLNMTCDPLGASTWLDEEALARQRMLLTNDALCTDAAQGCAKISVDGIETDPMEWAVGIDDDFKGWYIVLDKQGSCDASGSIDHTGEQVLAKTSLFNGVLYLTSYRGGTSSDNVCKASGDGFIYSLDYTNGTAAYDYDTTNNANGVVKEVRDRFRLFESVTSPPTGFSFRFNKDGTVQVVTTMGDMLTGPNPEGPTGLEAMDPNFKLTLFYWKDSNSRNPDALYDYKYEGGKTVDGDED